MHIGQSTLSIALRVRQTFTPLFHAASIGSMFLQTVSFHLVDFGSFLRNPVKCLFCSSAVFRALHVTKPMTQYCLFLAVVSSMARPSFSLTILFITPTFSFFFFFPNYVEYSSQAGAVKCLQAFSILFRDRPCFCKACQLIGLLSIHITVALAIPACSLWRQMPSSLFVRA